MSRIQELKALITQKLQALVAKGVDVNDVYAYTVTECDKNGQSLVETRKKVDGLENFAQLVKQYPAKYEGVDRRGNPVWTRTHQFQMTIHAELLADTEQLLREAGLEITGDPAMSAKTHRYLIRAAAPKVGLSEV